MEQIAIRSIFISDLHLGSKYARPDLLLEFLKGKHVENLYVVGDFIDGWKFSYLQWNWNDDCNNVIRKILKMNKKGTKIYYVVGNHDEFLRKFLHHDHEVFQFGSVVIGNSFIHEGIDGKKYLVIHGDAFDSVIQYAPFFAWLGDIGYEAMLRLNHVINFGRKLFGLSYWSFSAYAKNQVKKAVNHIGKFESHLSHMAKQNKCDGIIVGHIHHPNDKMIDGIRYLNCGDCVESNTAIVEYVNGEFEIIYHNQVLCER